nr:hypothetical protein [Tanacetum cinerariifolium]
HEAPPILTPVKLPSRYDVPKYVDRRYNECINSIKELQKKNDAHEKILMEVYTFYQGLRQDVPKTFTKETSSSFFDMVQRTSTYPKTFEEPIPSRHPTSYTSTLHTATLWHYKDFPRGLLPIRPVPHKILTLRILRPYGTTRFPPVACPSQNLDVGGVNRDEIHRGKRETFRF